MSCIVVLSDHSLVSSLFLFLFFLLYFYEVPSVFLSNSKDLFSDASLRFAFGVGSLCTLANLEQIPREGESYSCTNSPSLMIDSIVHKSVSLSQMNPLLTLLPSYYSSAYGDME